MDGRAGRLNLLIAVGASFVRVVLYDEVAELWGTGRVIGWVACILLAWLVARSRRVAMAWRGLPPPSWSPASDCWCCGRWRAPGTTPSPAG